MAVTCRRNTSYARSAVGSRAIIPFSSSPSQQLATFQIRPVYPRRARTQTPLRDNGSITVFRPLLLEHFERHDSHLSNRHSLIANLMLRRQGVMHSDNCTRAKHVNSRAVNLVPLASFNDLSEFLNLCHYGHYTTFRW